MELFNWQPKLNPSMLRRFLVVWVVLGAMLASSGDSRCLLEAVFNFGDSNSDTGGFAAAFPPPSPPPYGITYFNRPTGRVSDGRLIIDFIVSAFGEPFLNPYLESLGANRQLGPIFRHGANFATIGATVLPTNVSGFSPFHLAVQLNQMKRFKAKVDESDPDASSNLPPRDIFGKSLYVIYIGQNDITSNLPTLGITGVKSYFPRVISQIISTIKELYVLGGRTFLVQNLAPFGCYPMFLVQLPHNSSEIDEFGCMVSYNKAVVDYNNMLKKAISRIRPQLPGSNIVYADTHAVVLKLFQHPSSNGFKHGTRACCGYGGGKYNFHPRVLCGTSLVGRGRNFTAKACGDPKNYVNWDGVHLTEAANKVLANTILSGIHSDPPFEFHCAYD